MPPPVPPYRRILENPKFVELVKKRHAFSWALSAIMLVIYLGFILLVAFDKGLLAAKIGAGVTSLGIVLGIGVIISAFVLTGIYVWRANTHYDELTQDLIEEIER